MGIYLHVNGLPVFKSAGQGEALYDENHLPAR
jgi:hypothetical protein